jgi:hypothetical protein
MKRQLLPPAAGHDASPVPGAGTLSRTVRYGKRGGLQSVKLARLDLRPSDSRDLGIVKQPGRAVIGRLVLSPKSNADGERIREKPEIVKPFPYPPDVLTKSPAEKREWVSRWAGTPEAKAFLAGYQTFPIIVSPDGQFRAEAVPPGRWQLKVFVDAVNPNTGISGATAGEISLPFDVPEPVPGNEGPIDLGDVRPIKK